MRHSPWGLVVLAAVAATTSANAAAQSRLPWSLQASDEWVFPTKNYGDLLQSASTFKSDAANLTGTSSAGFLEPRYVVAVLAEQVGPCPAGRIGYGTLLIGKIPPVTENSFTCGAGAGILIALTPRLSIDAGSQYFAADFGRSGDTAGYFLARLGVAIGLF